MMFSFSLWLFSLVFLCASSAHSSAPKTIDIANDTFSCEETHRVQYQSAHIVQSVIKYSLCKSSSGKIGFYSPTLNSMTIVNGDQAYYKNLKPSSPSMVANESETIRVFLSGFANQNESDGLKLKVIDSNRYQEASQIAMLQLKKIRGESLSKVTLLNEIKVDGIDEGNSVLCHREPDREPISADDWLSFGSRSCSIYSCRSGSKK